MIDSNVQKFCMKFAGCVQELRTLKKSDVKNKY
jgi:hypothetical protein